MTRNQFNKLGIDAVILCGGLGTRLKPIVSDKQKCIADIDGRPFLDILIDMLVYNGFERIILAVCHLKEQVVEYAKNRSDCLIEFAIEDKPLGTGGALKNTKDFIQTEHFLAMNGDTFCPVHLRSFYNFHLDNNALFSLVVSKMENVSDYGHIEIDDFGKIINYHEKNSKSGNGFVNAGIYLMHKDIFGYMPEEEKFSLERDFFPKILDKNCYGYIIDDEFIDIGTPERYLRARQIFSKLTAR